MPHPVALCVSRSTHCACAFIPALFELTSTRRHAGVVPVPCRAGALVDDLRHRGASCDSGTHTVAASADTPSSTWPLPA